MTWVHERALYLLLIGFLLFVVPYVAPFSDNGVNILLSTIGSLLFGSGLIEGLFRIKFQKQVQKQVDLLKNNITTLQDTVAIASGAVESGLTAVYSTRKECLEKIESILIRQLAYVEHNRIESAVKIKLLGISLGDFLCPHGSLQTTFREILKHKEFEISILILNDGCNSSINRAIREERNKFKDVVDDKDEIITLKDRPEVVNVYKKTKCHDELKTATDYISDLAERHVIDRDEPAHDASVHAKLDVRSYLVNPMVFMFVINDDMFIENYHLAGRGGEAPILRVARYRNHSTKEESRLFKIFMGHFETVRDMSTPLIDEAEVTRNIDDAARRINE